MLTAKRFGCLGIANDSISSVQSFHEALQITLSDRRWSLLSDFNRLTGEFELLRKEMEKIVHVYHDRYWTPARYQMSLFLVADLDEMKPPLSMEGFDPLLDGSRMNEPAFQQPFESRWLRS